MLSLYDVIGVNKDATPEQIKAAWKKECSKSHPDKGGSDQRQRVVNEAYATLGDPERRKRYDETGAVGPIPSRADELQSNMVAFVTECCQILAKNPGANPVNLLSQILDQKEAQVHKMMNELNGLVTTLKRQKTRVQRRTPDGKRDLFQDVLDSTIANAEERLKQMPDMLQMLTEIRPMVEEYVCVSFHATKNPYWA